MSQTADQLGNPGQGSGGTVQSDRFTVRGPDGSEAEISDLRRGFRQGFVLEILDTTIGATIDKGVFVFPLNPTRYSLSEPFQATLTPTEDDTVVSEENGIITRDITLEGTFGLRDKKASGFRGAQGNGKPISGTAHFTALRSFFRRYSARKKDPLKNATTRMIFHALRDDDHFIVVPRSFETPRDSQRARVHYTYRLSLTVVGGAEESGLQAEDTSGFDFTDALRDINEAFQDARAAFAEVTANMSQIRRKVGNIQTIMINAAQVINAVGGVVSGTADLINAPLQSVATGSEALGNAADQLVASINEGATSVVSETFSENARSIRRIESAFDRFAMYPERFQDTAERVEEIFDGERRLTAEDIVASGTDSTPGAGGATVGSRTRIVAGSDGRLAGLEVPRGRGFRGVAVESTDTIESIASGAGTTPEAVIIINDLRPPYIAAGGGPGIAQAGDVLLVPADASEGSGTGSGTRDYLSSEEALYGVDLKVDDAVFDADSKFDIAVQPRAMDVAVTTGIQNVVQGTEITVNTERGTTVFIPTLGIRRNVGLPGTVQHVLLASIVLREAILSDTRISGIESARVVLDEDVLTQEITPIVSGRRQGATLVLPFGRASGGG